MTSNVPPIGLSPKMEEMMQGYLDGLVDIRTELPKQHNYSPAYAHGWLNGRDDRLHKPRDRASVLRARAEMILEEKVMSLAEMV